MLDSIVNLISTLTIPIIVLLFGVNTIVQLFNENVIFYQAKLFMFYNVWTTYWTSLVKFQLPSKTLLHYTTPNNNMH